MPAPHCHNGSCKYVRVCCRYVWAVFSPSCNDLGYEPILPANLATKNFTLPLSNIPLIHRFMILLGISGWRSRLCTIVFGLGVYLVVSALISTRKINFPTYDPLQQFRNLPPGDSSSLVARSLNSDTETHVSTTKIHTVDSQSPALRHHHHPRNLAAAIDHVQQKR